LLRKYSLSFDDQPSDFIVATLILYNVYLHNWHWLSPLRLVLVELRVEGGVFGFSFIGMLITSVARV
jgi:hypothetical protein